MPIDHAHKLKKKGLTSPNWTDSSISLDERQIKESRGVLQSLLSFPFPTYLGRPKETLRQAEFSGVSVGYQCLPFRKSCFT